jgi:hypothetical protein
MMAEAAVNSQSALQSGHARLIGWLSFLAWMAVGFGIVFGFFLFSIFVLAAAVLVGVLVALQPGLRRGALGLLSGAGAIFLWVAWLNRRGPGTIVTHTATSVSSTDTWDPRPWLAAGIVLVAGSMAAHAWLTARRQRSVHE